MKSASTLFLLSAVQMLAACHDGSIASNPNEAWNAANDPAIFKVTVKKFDEVALEGKVPDKSYPWSDTYWATYRGGIASRWQTDNRKQSVDYKDYDYTSLTPDEVKQASTTGDLNKLSPAEKYDIYMGHYDFPLTKAEKESNLKFVDATGKIPTWYGICHGWAPASYLEPEGGVVDVKNPQGVSIRFYSSDLNGLMSKLYADALGQTGSRRIGARCNTQNDSIPFDITGRVVNTECRDVNPGALHLVLGQLLGNSDESQRQSFVADISRDAEVWNQAVVGYKVVSKDSTPFDPTRDPRANYRAPGTKTLIHVVTALYYISEVPQHFDSAMAVRDRYTKSMTLEYTLELDGEGKIIGGEWISSSWPDFIWQPLSGPKTGPSDLLSYDTVKDLLTKSRQSGVSVPGDSSTLGVEGPIEGIVPDVLGNGSTGAPSGGVPSGDSPAEDNDAAL